MNFRHRFPAAALSALLGVAAMLRADPVTVPLWPAGSVPGARGTA